MSEKISDGSQVERLTYTRSEVCKALGISVTTLWRLEKAGIVKPLNLGLRMRLYSVQAIRRLVENGGGR